MLHVRVYIVAEMIYWLTRATASYLNAASLTYGELIQGTTLSS